MTSSSLKLIAIIIMTIDHTASIIGQEGLIELLPGASMKTTFFIYQLLHGIGRIAFPIFAFTVSESCKKTNSMPRYVGRLVLFAVISEPIYYIAFNPVEHSLNGFISNLLSFHFTNVLFTLAIGAVTIYIYKLFEQYMSRQLMLFYIPVVFFSLYVGESIHCDYGMQGILLIVALYLAHSNRTKMLVIMIWSVVVYWAWLGSAVYCVCAALSCIIIFFYNGKLGNGRKYFFYAYILLKDYLV